MLFHRNFCIFLLLTAPLLVALPSQAEGKELKNPFTKRDEEAFLIKRIAEFWKDGDFTIVKGQILEFLDRYPKTSSKESLLALLGDLYFHENAYEKAVSTYQQLLTPILIEKILLNKLQCYYELGKYEALAKEGKPYAESPSLDIQSRREEFDFLMGEALLKLALESEKEGEKVTLARQAQSHYDALSEGQYKESALFALAEIHGLLGENEKGATLYRKLAEKYSEMEEDLLFEAASLQAKYDPTQAISSFKEVREKGGKRANEAAFNLIVLLSESERDQEVIDLQESLTKGIPKELECTFNYVVGKSFFSKKDYEKALLFLKNCKIPSSISPEQLKNSLLMQMTCAHQLKDPFLFKDLLDAFESKFPDDPDLPNALLIHALLIKEQGRIGQATEEMEAIKEKYPEFNRQEHFAFEFGLLAHENEEWEKSYDSFKAFLSDFTKSPHSHAAWKLFLSSAFNRYKSSRSEPTQESKAIFFKDLQAVLNHSDCLSEEERQECALLYAKVACELDRYTEALEALDTHLFHSTSNWENSNTIAEGHLIASLCYAEGERNPSQFSTHLNQAVSLNPNLYDSPLTHLHLYNAYISLAGYGNTKTTPPDPIQKKEWIDRAAAHLQEALSTDAISTSQQNILWLANHLHEKGSEYFNSLVETHPPPPSIAQTIAQAISHYQKLLTSDETLIPIDPSAPFLEEATLQLAQLFGYQNNHQKKISLLKDLLKQQIARQKIDSALQAKALFELAIAYQEAGEGEKALETYTFIQTLKDPCPLTFVSRSILESARLQFALLDPDLKRADSPELISILNDLKTLQICKHPTSEPIHLEAALDYAQIRSLIADEGEREERYHFFLDRIREDFNSEQDPTTQGYLAHFQDDPSKKPIFDAYMTFIASEKVRLQIYALYKKNQLDEIDALEKTRLDLYEEIQKTPKLPRDLLKRIHTSLKETLFHSNAFE